MALVAFVAVIIAFVGTQPANAYHLEGPKWQYTPASGCCAYIHVSPNGAADSSGLNIMSSFDKQGFIGAVNAWNGSPANVYLDFHSGALTLYDPTVSNVSWDGLTTWQTNSQGYFANAQVKLNTYYTRNESASEIQGVAAHELGHAMGLAHSSTCVLMNPTTPRCGIDTPQSDDVNGINHLY
jgi:hypothetical protein